jgi:hypothetical protein
MGLIGSKNSHSILDTVQKAGGFNRMCDDFIHQGLTHDPTVSRRAFSFAAAATAVALYAPDAAA